MRTIDIHVATIVAILTLNILIGAAIQAWLSRGRQRTRR